MISKQESPRLAFVGREYDVDLIHPLKKNIPPLIVDSCTIMYNMCSRV